MFYIFCACKESLLFYCVRVRVYAPSLLLRLSSSPSFPLSLHKFTVYSYVLHSIFKCKCADLNSFTLTLCLLWRRKKVKKVNWNALYWCRLRGQISLPSRCEREREGEQEEEEEEEEGEEEKKLKVSHILSLQWSMKDTSRSINSNFCVRLEKRCRGAGSERERKCSEYIASCITWSGRSVLTCVACESILSVIHSIN